MPPNYTAVVTYEKIKIKINCRLGAIFFMNGTFFLNKKENREIGIWWQRTFLSMYVKLSSTYCSSLVAANF